ncbi:MAG: ASKHA domain-containing protein, partial [bacterium]|nr:ASKHA domain-containing protein [bacterium]
GRTFSYILWDQGSEVQVTQNDVRAVQLAKAALLAGARLLMDHLGTDQVDRIRLAGAFGSHLSASHSMALGLIPEISPERASSAGNAAGTGALMTLLSGECRREIEQITERVEKIETAIEPRFQEHFVEAMSFPGARRSRDGEGRVNQRRSRRGTSRRTRERRR